MEESGRIPESGNRAKEAQSRGEAWYPEGEGRAAEAGNGGRKRCAEGGSVTAAQGVRAGVVLSERLQMLADMVTPGNRLVDVGCDHGYLSVSLVASGICPGAIAMDVRKGPLEAAKIHIAEAGLNDYIDVRLSDGLAGCGQGEADTMVCAGMGGRLMERILREGMEKARGMRELILQPQSELPQFRAFLREAGFRVAQEDAVIEDGKYYFAIKAAYGPEARQTGGSADALQDGETDGGSRERQELYDLYGEHLLRQKHPVLRQYLLRRESSARQLERSLAASGSPRAAQRRGEVQRELEGIGAALAYYME